jgi:hypothetical protein
MPTAHRVPALPADPAHAPAIAAVVPHSPAARSSGECVVRSGADTNDKSIDRVKGRKKTGGAPFIDFTHVPPQPLILKNALLRGGGRYKDNTRRRPVKAGSSRYTGVYLDKAAGKWKAQIMVDGRVRSIGYYEREEDAAGDYARAAFKYKVSIGELTYGGLDLGAVPERPLIAGGGASGYRGVKNVKGRWQARIAVEKGGNARTLGTFDSAEAAASIYAQAAFYLERRKANI